MHFGLGGLAKAVQFILNTTNDFGSRNTIDRIGDKRDRHDITIAIWIVI